MEEHVLVAAIPLRHLEAARERCADAGSVVLPAGGPGDLDAAAPGTPVLLIATDAGETEVPAVTWSATLVTRVPHEPGDPWPPGVPPTWAGEHIAPGAPTPTERSDDDDADDDLIGPQAFFEVTDLAPRPRQAWIFANELVPKQQRRGRAFVPRTPRLLVPLDRPV